MALVSHHRWRGAGPRTERGETARWENVGLRAHFRRPRGTQPTAQLGPGATGSPGVKITKKAGAAKEAFFWPRLQSGPRLLCRSSFRTRLTPQLALCNRLHAACTRSFLTASAAANKSTGSKPTEPPTSLPSFRRRWCRQVPLPPQSLHHLHWRRPPPLNQLLWPEELVRGAGLRLSNASVEGPRTVHELVPCHVQEFEGSQGCI